MTDLPGIIEHAQGIVEHAQGIHSAIADGLKGFGGVLRCTGACKREDPLVESDIARYMRDGWPKCCGYTKTWVTQRQLDEERAADA